MTFAAPLYLLGLVPLAALVIYLLWGRRRQEAVPFLDLWLGPVKGPKPKRRIAAPPLAVALAILAMLLAVLGAAGPALRDPTASKPISVIIDNGVTMSATGRRGAAAAAAQQAMGRLGPLTKVELVVVPGETKNTDVSDFAGIVTQLAPTALDTADLLRGAVARQLATTAGPVVVLSDRDIGIASERPAQVPPAGRIQNVGIQLLAARETPRAQVMVRIGNDAGTTKAELRVSTAGREAVQEIDLPPRGSTRDYFVDLESLGDVVKAELRVANDLPADDVAWLVRRGSPPLIEPRAEVPPELRRMVDVYTSSRPPAQDAPRVAIVRELAALPPGAAGVILATAGGAAPAGVAAAQVTPHPVTHGTTWSVSGAVRLAPPPEGFAPLVRFGDRPAVAVRESPARQVWVGLESDEWPRTPEYVVFWANVFDWLGGGDVRFTSHPPEQLEGAWRPVEMAGGAAPAPPPGLWPGLYERAEDRAVRAINAAPIRLPPPPADEWKQRLDRLLSRHARGAARPLSPAVLLAAAACLAAAAAAWKRSQDRNLTAFSAGRTVPDDRESS